MGEYKNRMGEYHTIENRESSVEYPWKGLHIELSNVCNYVIISALFVLIEK